MIFQTPKICKYWRILLGHFIKQKTSYFWRVTQHTSGLQQLAGVHDPPESCDIPIKAEFNGDYHGGSVKTGNG